MKRTLPLWSFFFLLCTASAQAQLYKWVGPDGKVTYGDTPPPAAAKQLEAKSLNTTGGVNTAGFPYDLSEAVKNHPVTLYTTKDCAPCDEGRTLLGGRGIPFSEKTVTSNEDIAQFKKINSDGQLPFLLVGRNRERGFESSAWNTALTSAGYPETRKLPRNYRNPPAEAAAPAARAVAASPDNQPQVEAPAATQNSTEPPPAVGNPPPGFRF